eukprot:TRINITY_DN8439_c0_g1_i1.p1 TRINITY_DN8439_c0_g1~~TRINITY_DN8439_c0_g1_i1.p1  ORF type:complete len:167 (-),score=10.22 TRINITY_DN8439_c0_g1_i1:45-545(-)
MVGYILLALLALFSMSTEAHTCFLFQSQYQTNLLAFGCAGLTFPVPSAIEGWVGPKRTCFTVDCTDCSCLLNTTSSDGLEIDYETLKNGMQSAKVDESVDYPYTGEDPVPCCLYSDPNYYYTKPLDTAAINPYTGEECSSTMYGLTLIGQWYVTSMYNMCYFAPQN